ncbi:MAG: DUF2294 domain-containing protein [Bacillota bacterium]
MKNNSSVIFDKKNSPQLFNEQQRKQLQHEIKLYLQRYGKENLGKGADYCKVNICDDLLIIRGEGYLTEPEKYIARTPSGREKIRASRIEVIIAYWQDNKSYFEEKLQAKVVHHIYDLDPGNDFWMHTIMFDRQLTK